MNPTETPALVVKPHCLTLTVLWVLKDSLASSLPSLLLPIFPSLLLSLLTSFCPSPALWVIVSADREPRRIINRLSQYSLHPRCREQGFYVPADGRSNSLLMGATQPHCSLKMNGDKLSELIITHTHTWVWPTLHNTDNSGHLQRHIQWHTGREEQTHRITRSHQHQGKCKNYFRRIKIRLGFLEWQSHCSGIFLRTF